MVNDSDFQNEDYEEPLSPLDIEVLWNRLKSLEYNNMVGIIQLEQDLYSAIKQFPLINDYSILMLHLQLMKGQIERANVMAYKIWEKGGDIRTEPYLLYLQDLVALNLREMASEICESFISELDDLPEELFVPLFNFAFAQADADLILSLAARMREDVFEVIQNIIQSYQESGAWDIFADFQDIIFTKTSHQLCDYNIEFNAAGEYPVLIINLYVSTLKNQENDIIIALQQYCAENMLAFPNNLEVKVLAIQSHLPVERSLLPV